MEYRVKGSGVVNSKKQQIGSRRWRDVYKRQLVCLHMGGASSCDSYFVGLSKWDIGRFIGPERLTDECGRRRHCWCSALVHGRTPNGRCQASSILSLIHI